MTSSPNRHRIDHNLTKSKIFPTLLSFAFPIILTNIFQQLYSIVNLVVIGKFVGSIGTVGVNTGGELADMFAPIAMGFATAGQIYITQLIGVKNFERTGKTTLYTLFYSLTFAVIASLFI